MSQNLEKLKRLLAELFQLDQAELDFGIYRIMNARREEITRFLNNDLLPQVRAVLGAYERESRSALQAELEKAKEQAKALGFEDPSQAPKVKELQERYNAAFDLEASENEVFSHLYNFFRRYYLEGDFISLRRYKEGVYAIPYEGEEVKLYWANHDQYYIKTSEYLRNYTFKLPSGKRVHFKLVEADTEKDNNRPQNGKERRFILSEKQPLAEENGELVIRFEYRPDLEKRKQTDLNAEAVKRILSMIANSPGLLEAWSSLLEKRPTEKNPNRTLLEKHLTDYTARNTFDYFIHKDLGSFLRRELDFYIKNEVMHLDDIESETVPRVEQYLSKIKAIRRIAHKIIDFLAQLENFQKKLWLKKKFVVETQYCVTLDRVLEELYPEIAANDAQREEWVRLFAIDEIKGDLTTPRYSVPLTVEFLKANPYLVLDTRHFSEDFKRRLLASFDDLDEQCDGLLIHSENFQALNLLMERYRGQVQCIYIDPPYNTGSDEFVYKDRYQTSSWLQCLMDRLLLAHRLLADDGVLVIQISDHEDHRLKLLLDVVFGPESFVNRISVKTRSPSGFKTVNLGVFEAAEYLYVYAKDKKVLAPRTVYIPCEHDSNYRYLVANKEEDPRSWIINKVDDVVAEELGFHTTREAVRRIGRQAFDAKVAEYAIRNADRVFRYTAINDAGASRETVDLKYKSMDNPDSIFVQSREGYEDRYIQNGQELTFYSKKVREIDGRMTPTMPVTNIWTDIAWEGIATEGGVTLKQGKKPERLVQRLLEMFTDPGDMVLDFFAGTGTTAAVAQKMQRNWIAVEMAEEIAELMKTRMMNVLAGHKSGIPPLEGQGNAGCFQFVRLEAYEDTLNNLELKRTEAQQSLLEQHPAFREDYMLHYMLDVESHGSPSLLNLDRFEDPFNYKLNIATGTVGETKPTAVDLVETFNYLIGLRVKTIDHIGSVRVVTGTNPQGERVLILWRNTKEMDNDKLDDWFQKQGYNTKDQEYDVIYVNGDNNLENLKRPDQTWKVRLTEEEFLRRMFDVVDV